MSSKPELKRKSVASEMDQRSSWLNDAVRRTANTLDVYIPVSERPRFVKHYIIEKGSTLGSNSRIPHLPRYGNEYLWSPRTILKKTLVLGFHTNRWDTPQSLEYSTIGYFENDTFRPGEWVTAYPNPAFQWCTNRDGFWGAKIVTVFSDEDITTIVKTGRLSSSKAEAALARLLIERRDIIGRTNPLDRFSLESGNLHFEDLATTRRLADPVRTRYRPLDGNGRPLGTFTETKETLIPIRDDATSSYQEFEIQTGHPGWGKTLRVFLHTNSDGESKVVRVDREE